MVEDEHRVANYVKKGLETKSHIVDVAYDGEEGFDLASEEKYDVVVLDRMLPKMDGLTICKKLREEGIHVPILMLTAKSAVEDKVDGLEAGADDYLAKPFAFNELLARVKALGRRPRNQTGEVLKVGNLELNTNTYEVKRDGKKIALSKKEYALLEYLMRNKAKVLTAEQIVEQVWPYDSNVLLNTAQVYIGYLRKKIDQAFHNKPSLIKTVRGFGYKIEEK